MFFQVLERYSCVSVKHQSYPRNKTHHPSEKDLENSSTFRFVVTVVKLSYTSSQLTCYRELDLRSTQGVNHFRDIDVVIET